ncbi:MAG: histidine--tRNA ligase [Betaproteobacteria bacterium]|nr:histidine--tRNA ligase [Betaproteobacteria bacterium]
MAEKISAVKGMNDVLPPHSGDWEWLESMVRQLMFRHGYKNIRTPIVEPTGLFIRGLGEVTDIVEKEMYSFSDRLNGEELTLRPENTAGVVRACIEHSLLHEGGKRLYYMGPMFRHERPQRGRYRQFHQIGAEALGFGGPEVDAEIILLAESLWKALGLQGVRLEVNSLGQLNERHAHRAALITYLEKHHTQLDADAKRRLHSNPLRILDTKNPDLQDLVNDAPQLVDFLGTASLDHFNRLREILDACQISYRINPRLVRGMDYYNLTVFEFITDSLGSQGTSVERVIELLRDQDRLPSQAHPDIYAIVGDSKDLPQVFPFLQTLRGAGLSVQMHASPRSEWSGIKAQFKKADASGATYALIFGPDELKQGMVACKPLRNDQQAQGMMALADLAQWAGHLQSAPR